MRIAFLIRMLVVDAVCGNPENGSSLKSQGGANGKEILDPFGSLIAAMSQQAVVPHADSKASRNPPQEHCDQQDLPGKKEQRRDRTDMEQGHKSCGYPVNFIVCSCLPVQRFEVDCHGVFP
jgi:hypothetical protein